MGNCTSKKSAKSLKLSATKKTIFHSKMDKEQDIHTKGLSKKIVPFTKGEVTSFGFKKKISSQLPIPVTLTSNGHSFHETEDKNIQNGIAGQKSLSDGYHSGSSIESLCHAPFRSTPKMIRKKDLVKQQIISPVEMPDEKGGGFLSVSANNVKNVKTNTVVTSFQPSSASVVSQNESNKFSNNNCNSGSASKNNLEPAVNRFGFRQPTPQRALETIAKNSNKNNGVSHVARTSLLTDQGPYDTGSYTSKKKPEVSSRSRSEGPREAFFRQELQPANSVQSGLNQSKTSLSNTFQPGKFTLQTSHLPRPQFPVRMLDTKMAKTEANYYKRGGVPSSNSSKEGPLNEDSGFESHSSANNTLEKNLEILESSPGCKVRRRLPACKGKKLEMKIVGNKFELLKKEDGKRSDVVTEVSLIKLPSTNPRTAPVGINTGLVEQRTNQYLKRISQTYNKKDSEGGLNKPKTPISKRADTSVSSHGDEGLGAESEEEKLFKDSKKSEKYLMSDGCEEDMLSGEAMAEDISLCLSFEEETIATCPKNTVEISSVQHCDDVTPNTIRLDALKLSKQLKSKNSIHFNRGAETHRKDDSSSFGLLNECEKDDETFPSDSILEQLSSDSDSLGDKGENKNNDKEKNLKMANLNLDKEDLGIDLEEDDRCSSKSDTDVEENELELNNDETDVKEGSNNCLGMASPDSPGTPTHASNSQSLSDGRDFLIDDEIADQPQLCFSETYVDCSCQEDAKTTNEKTLNTVNTEYVTCTEIKTFTINKEGEIEERCVNGVEIPEVPITVGTLNLNREEGRKRLNSEGTLSPCESIGSDDLMLDFETNSFEETADRTGGGKFLKAREENSGCTTPGSTKSPTIISRVASSPLRPSKSSPADDDAVKVDKISYDNMFQDIVSIKAMLLKLKRLLSECATFYELTNISSNSIAVGIVRVGTLTMPTATIIYPTHIITPQDIMLFILILARIKTKGLRTNQMKSEGSQQENGRLCSHEGTIDNMMEDELEDLRRQVLFLQQQLEEREKMVQNLKLEINRSAECGTGNGSLEAKKQCNAATQTGSDQFQQDFPHFRILQTTPVV